MKSVLRSAKPYWIYLIIKGIKEIEVGKDFPKSEDWNKTVEMYCSKDNKSFNRIPKKDREWMRKYLGKVACQFVCDKIEKFVVGSFRCDDIEELSCLNYAEIINYFYKPEELDGKTAKFGYAWHITDLKIYDTPKELGEFRKPCDWAYDCNTCKKALYEHKLSNFYNKIDFVGCNNEIARPPQSWCYVEEQNV